MSADSVRVTIELAETFEQAGLLPIPALDLAESIVANPCIQKQLRALTGDLLLISGGRGLQGSD